MTRPEHVDRVLDDWLAEGPSEMPDRLLDSIVRQLNENEQRGPGWASWREMMNRMILATGGVAAALAIALVAVGLYVSNPGPGGPPAATSTPQPTSGPSPAAASPPPTPEPKVPSGLLEPGRYFTVAEGYRFTYTVSDPGWTQTTSQAVGKGPDPGGANLLLFGSVANIYADPCRRAGTLLDPAPGPTAADLAQALTSVQGVEATDPTDVVVGGYDGKHLRLTGAENVDAAECDGGGYSMWPGERVHDPATIFDFWILDLNDRRFVISVIHDAGTPTQTLEEAYDMVESMEIEPDS